MGRRGWLPIPKVAAHHLSQAVAPEEAAEHDTSLLLVPAEVLAHGNSTDGHGDAGTVQQASAQQQHPHPCLALRPMRQTQRREVRTWRGSLDSIPVHAWHSESSGPGEGP